MAAQVDVLLEKLEKRIAENPFSRAFPRLADGYRKNGDVQKAISICQVGLENHPDNTTGRLILGRCFLEQDNFPSAIEEFKKVCQIDRHNYVAVKMLADIYSKQNLKEKAGNLYAVLLHFDPINPALVHLSGIFKGTGKTDLFEILEISTPSASQQPDTSIPEEDAISEALPEIMPEFNQGEPASVTGISGTDVSEHMDSFFSGDETVLASGEQDLKDILTPHEASEEPAVADDLVPSHDTASAMEALETPEIAEVAEPPVISPMVPDADSAAVTGDDISNRMDSLFGNDEAETLEPVSELDTMITDGKTVETDIASLRAAMDKQQEDISETAISGSDIGSRLDEMFADNPITEETPEVPVAQLDEVEIGDEISVGSADAVDALSLAPDAEMSGIEETDTLDDVSESASEELPAVDGATRMFNRDELLMHAREAGLNDTTETSSVEELPVEPALNSKKSATNEPLSGDDVADRIEALFGDEPQAIEDVADVAVSVPEITEEIATDETLIIDRKALGLEMAKASPAPEIPPADDAIDMSDTLLADADEALEDPLADGKTVITTVASLMDAVNAQKTVPVSESLDATGISSADVDERLDEMFGLSSDSIDTVVSADTQPEASATQSDIPEIREVSASVPEKTAAKSSDNSGMVSGDDIVNRLDMLFGSDDGLSDVPDDEPDEPQKPSGDGFYTVSGAAAGEDNRESDFLSRLESDDGSQQVSEGDANELAANQEVSETTQIPETEITIASQKLSESDTLEVPLDTMGLSDVLSETVADESLPTETNADTMAISEDLPTSAIEESLATETGIDTVESEPENSSGEIVLTDATDDEQSSLDTLSSGLLDSSLDGPEGLADSLPDDIDDDVEESPAASGFYSVTGSNAQDNASDDVLATISELESEDATISAESDIVETDVAMSIEPVGALEESAVETANEPEADMAPVVFEELPTQKIPLRVSVPSVEAAPVDEAQTLDVQRKLSVIPDHVLTPTLADIYYQQGQPGLAIAIYQRLLERTPGNERLVNRIKDIESALAAGTAPEDFPSRAVPESLPMRTSGRSKSLQKSSTSALSPKGKTAKPPLKGVRIKKKIKATIKKKK